MKNYLISDWVVYKIIQNEETIDYRRVVDLNIFFRRAILPAVIILTLLILMGAWWDWSNDYMELAFKIAEEALESTGN